MAILTKKRAITHLRILRSLSDNDVLASNMVTNQWHSLCRASGTEVQLGWDLQKSAMSGVERLTSTSWPKTLGKNRGIGVGVPSQEGDGVV
jgi:hypothetical protein